MALKPGDGKNSADFKFASMTTANSSNPASTLMTANHHNNSSGNRPFSEPPPYGISMNTRPTPTYAQHVSNSTINKFNRDHQQKASAGQNKPTYVPLGDIRRNNITQQPPPAQIRPSQPLVPHSGSSGYQSMAAFSNQPTPARTKEEDESGELSMQSEEELAELAPSVLARRLIESQNRLKSQAAELKSKSSTFIVLHFSF